MKLPPLQTVKIPAVALAAGLLIGLGFGWMQIKKEEKICTDKIKEKDRKIAFIQKKLTEEKAEATSSLEQKCRYDLSRLEDALLVEKKKSGTLSGQVGALTEQVKKLEMRVAAADETAAKRTQEFQEALRSNKELDRELKKTLGEKQTLQADLRRTTRERDVCTSNNADLALIAEELVKKYKDKGFGSVLLEKEPLTQVKKVELEQLTNQYREEIEQKRVTKK